MNYKVLILSTVDSIFCHNSFVKAMSRFKSLQNKIQQPIQLDTFTYDIVLAYIRLSVQSFMEKKPLELGSVVGWVAKNSNTNP